MRALFSPPRVSSASIILVMWCATITAAGAMDENSCRQLPALQTASRISRRRRRSGLMARRILSGVWTGRVALCPESGRGISPGEVSYQPWAKALVDERAGERANARIQQRTVCLREFHGSTSCRRPGGLISPMDSSRSCMNRAISGGRFSWMGVSWSRP